MFSLNKRNVEQTVLPLLHIPLIHDEFLGFFLAEVGLDQMEERG